MSFINLTGRIANFVESFITFISKTT